MEVIFDDMIIYSASQSLIKTVSAGVRFFSVPAKAKAFLFKRKPGYKAHYRFTRTLISIALRNIQLFNMQLTAVSGRGIKNIATVPLVLGPEPKTEGGRQLRLFLEPKWEAVTADAMVVKGSYRALAKEIGAEVDSGGALKHIQDCIERLWKVSIIAQNGRKRQGFRLLSEYASDEADGRLYVALNPLIAQAVMGGGQHVRISMDEVRALDSETARLLHQRLCGWIDPGKTGKASIDTLCGYVWPSEASGSTMRKRRQRVREALPELVALGWTVTEFAAGKYDITRPKAAG